MATTVDNLIVSSSLRLPEDGLSFPLLRASVLKQETLLFPVKFTDFRTWDAAGTNLPNTAANDDLALVTGTWGTNPLRINAGDVKATSSTRRAIVEVCLPECYVAGQAVSFVLSAGMVTTIADGSCTVDLEVYRRDKDAGIGSDICATAAMTINSTSFSDKTFTITPSTLNPGDVLDVRLSIAYVDTATATAVTPTIGGFDLSCSCRG